MIKFSKIAFLLLILVLATLDSYTQIDSFLIKKQGLEKQVRQFKLLNDLKQEAYSRQELGKLYLSHDSVQMAEFYFTGTLNLLESLHDTLALFETNIIIGEQYESKLHFSIALRYYLSANKFSVDLNPNDRIRILKKIGTLYYDLENYSRALSYFIQCKEFAENNNILNELSSAYINIGEVHRFSGQYNKAYNSYMKSLEIEIEFDDQMGIAINYNNLAWVFLQQKKYDEAFKYFTESRKIVNKLGDIEKIASLHTGFGHYYLAIRNYDKAIASFLKTLDYKLPTQTRKDIIYRDAYEGLYLTYSSAGDYKNALKYYQLYSSLKEKISGIKTQDQLMEVETMFAVEKQVQKAQFFEQVAKLEKLKKKRQSRLFSLIVLLLLATVILLFISLRLKFKTFRQKKDLFEQEKRLDRLELEKKEAENLRLASVNSELEASKIISQLKNNHFKMELAHKKRELASLVLHLSSKNEILAQIKENLIKRKFLSENEQVISTILAEINSNLNLDKDWNSFKLHFEEIHPDFFKRLHKKYPDITNEELKLCAYLRVNLSSKEIAQLLSITPIAVNKRRNRLRKKINIGQEVSLYEFMADI